MIGGNGPVGMFGAGIDGTATGGGRVGVLGAGNGITDGIGRGTPAAGVDAGFAGAAVGFFASGGSAVGG